MAKVNRERPKYKDALAVLTIFVMILLIELGLGVAIAASSSPGLVRGLAFLLLYPLSLLAGFLLAFTIHNGADLSTSEVKDWSISSVVLVSSLFFPGLYLLSSPKIAPFILKTPTDNGTVLTPLWLGHFLMAQGLSLTFIGGFFLLWLLTGLVVASFGWIFD